MTGGPVELLLAVAILGAITLWIKNHDATKRNAALSTQIKKQAELITVLKQKREELVSACKTLDSKNKNLAAELRKHNERLAAELGKQNELASTINHLREELNDKSNALSKYGIIMDAEKEARSILGHANLDARWAREDAERTLNNANIAAKAKIEESNMRLHSATAEAERIITTAKRQAEQIAGEAYSAMSRAKELSETATAMQHIIEGYGDAYIVPSYNLLDDLADEFGHTDAGQALKVARDTSRMMIKTGHAARCDYSATYRQETAIHFVTDAFNGKVDSILSRSKTDNHGKLEQEIRDAFALVNHNGRAFRNARVTENYLAARLNELKWASTAHALKDREREEQRRLREQMRQEEKARREYERAIKDAAKEEESIRKAMEKVQQQVAAATDAQRAEYEAKLLDLEGRLRAAEEKNQRALSMAQQTRTGHVYIISNIGSFGEEVFKIGMTRRLEPADRIRELGDASVPFEFDVHAMIFSEDAPGLEKALHRHFLRRQMNKVNPRKEFFRVGLADIRLELEQLGIETHWTMTAEAREYRESLRIEEQIHDNPTIAQEWTRHQMEFEPQEEAEEAV